VGVHTLVSRPPSLEDVFLRYYRDASDDSTGDPTP